MNRKLRAYLKCFSIAVVSGAFLIWSEMPLWRALNSLDNPTLRARSRKMRLPDAPQAQSAQPPAGQQTTPVPSGAAGAKSANPKGAPVAQPAGAAVAPVRQRGHRSLLIKLGLVAGAGIAVGSVVAMSEKSPTRPPGAAAAMHP